MLIEQQIASIGAILEARGVNVTKMKKEMRSDNNSETEILQSLVGVLYTGLTYGNWPSGNASDTYDKSLSVSCDISDGVPK